MTRAEVALQLALKAMDHWRPGASHSPGEEAGQKIAALFNTIYSQLKIDSEPLSPERRAQLQRMKERIEAEGQKEE